MAHAAPRLIDRGDLLAALDRAATRKVTIISAPAGSGKTSLVRAWADGQGERRRLALLQVQRDQQDAQQFWLALLDAVCDASAVSGRAIPQAATPEFNPSAMVDRVLAELADASVGLTVVIEDLHELNSPEAVVQLTRLLANLPPGAHAMLTTRHDLPLRPASAAPGGRAGRDPRGRPALHRARNPAAARCLGDRAVRIRGSAAAPADGGVGRGPAARGDLAGRPS